MSFLAQSYIVKLQTNKQKVKFISNVGFHTPFIYNKCSILFKYLRGHSLNEIVNSRYAP